MPNLLLDELSPEDQTLLAALPTEGAQWMQDRAITPDAINLTQLHQFGEHYNRLHPNLDPAQWSGPPPNYLAGLSASGSELNPQGLGPAFIPGFHTYGEVAPGTEAWQGQWQPYDNQESYKQIQQGTDGFDTSYFRDPRADAWYAAHPSEAVGYDGVTPSVAAMLADIPDAGVGSPLGRMFAVGPERERQRIANEAVNPGPWYSTDPTTGLPPPPPPPTEEQRDLIGRQLPPLYTVGMDLPSTNNYWLMPPGFQNPDYSMRNGRLISEQKRIYDSTPREGWQPRFLPPGSDYPFVAVNIGGVAYPVASWGWPGQLNFGWYTIDPKVT